MEFHHPVRVVRAQLKTRRALVTSDIHGSLDLFKALLKKLQYKPGEDTLVIIGDLVQKGSQNLDTIRFVMELSKLENVFVLMGNNDLFTLEGPDREIFEHGSYFRECSMLGEMAMAMGLPFPKSVKETHVLREKAKGAFPEEHRFLQDLPHVLETEQFLFAHAGLQSEDLERQELEYVLSVPRFHETVNCTFHKLLLTGHWPTANYRRDKLSNAPLYNQSRHVLSIDGGNRVKTFGQLNGVILDPRTGGWFWDSVDNFPKIRAPFSQKARSGSVITWPENHVELLEQGEHTSLCRIRKTGEQVELPNELLYTDDEGLRTDDFTSDLLEVSAGEELAVVWKGNKWMLAGKNGKMGLVLLEGEGKEHV